MKHWMGALALVGAIGLAATPAWPGELWRGVGTRMDHDMVTAKFPPARRPDSQPRLPGPDVGELAAPVDLAGHPATATFYFSRGGLVDVTVAVTDPNMQAGESGLAIAKAVAEQIDQDLDQKRRCKELSHESLRRYDCVWPVANNRLARLSYAEPASGAPMLSVIFRPVSRAQTDVDRAAELNAERTQVDEDAFSKTTTFHGPIASTNPLFGSTSVEWHMRSVMDWSTHTVEHQLYVYLSFTDETLRHYNAATDSEGDNLGLVEISHSARCKGCGRSETVGVALHPSKLALGLSKPYSVKIYALSGDAEIVPVNASMIRGQLMAIADHGGPALPPRPGDDAEPAPLDFGATWLAVAAKGSAPAAVRLDNIDGAGVAASAGLRNGDVVTAIDSAAVSDVASAQAAVAAVAPGRRVFFDILRGGKPMTPQVQF